MSRRKKPKSDTQDDTATAGPGHNKPPELTEDERRVLTYQWKADYQAADKAVKEATAARKSVGEKAKAELGKSAIADIKELILLEQPHAGDALRADMERKARLARWANLPVGTQVTFADFDGTPAVDAARELGKTAGLKGEVMKPPYDPSVPQYQEWIGGYHEGQAVLCSNFREKLKPVVGDPAQIDLAERNDLAPTAAADVSKPPFAIGDEPPRAAAE